MNYRILLILSGVISVAHGSDEKQPSASQQKLIDRYQQQLMTRLETQKVLRSKMQEIVAKGLSSNEYQMLSEQELQLQRGIQEIRGVIRNLKEPFRYSDPLNPMSKNRVGRRGRDLGRRRRD